ncbi:biotin/lipoyl-binding protein [Arthrobacter sp. I2-34]|uniref:biotin carboxylase n=1 Tax=Arthrobacter hankyongi TaxID=2904801 RepID=A0ABS9L149_9MICC|nr:biotin carboxylase N-terminal domain-containing protein [Arthrobacter hankyongi]MCG2620396.1 biotin/lipoyl-binding protein [Arthrobacter hankyongi]
MEPRFAAPFDTVLVANRGEIACRVIRTCARLGLRTVAVYSDADAGARHVREADVAVRLGPAPAAQSYLDIAAVLAACKATGAQAVHPGYGFLSENAAFAEALAATGIVFVGPGRTALAVMGDKIRAKEQVAAYGVPVVPGVALPDAADAGPAAAAEVGYPLLIKPSAGGGGKGMYAVERPEDLAAALAAARRVAASAFGDDTLLLERLVAAPRHIEVQVLADSHGNVIHLGERECSLQRRHQKVIEEAPSPLLDAATRDRIGEAACRAAASVDYTGAGTVEFLVSDTAPDEFFFMEMNTRLQVEHPVTEMVTGLDLVEWQLRIAAGQQLGLAQADVRLRGHAVEARIYAEDPQQGFLPAAGTVLKLAEPAGSGVRVDSSLAEGLQISPSYDPMLSKVIAWGADRQEALARLDRALAGTVVLGVDTNIEYLRLLLADPDVQAGRLETTLIERRLPELAFHHPSDTDLAIAAVAAVAWQRDRAGLPASTPESAGVPPWRRGDGWRPGAAAAQLVSLDSAAGGPREVQVYGTPAQARVRLETAAGQAPLAVELQPAAVVVDGIRWPLAWAVGEDHRLWLNYAGRTLAWQLRDRARRLRDSLEQLRRSTGEASPEVRSPMPGTVTAVAVRSGEQVQAGQLLLSVEAMKMEHQLTAPMAGQAELSLRPGDLVKAGQMVAVIHPETKEGSHA